jgi:hypothetical protein
MAIASYDWQVEFDMQSLWGSIKNGTKAWRLPLTLTIDSGFSGNSKLDTRRRNLQDNRIERVSQA